MARYMWVLFILCMFSGVLTGAPLQGVMLERHTQAALSSTSGLFIERFSYMRYYKTDPYFHLSPRSLEQQHQQALAFYLLNMYVSTHLYQQPAPEVLSLDYLGVLDGFEYVLQPFDFAHASSFYQQHKRVIQHLFQKHLQAREYPWPVPTNEQFISWVKLLENIPRKQHQAVYTWPSSFMGPEVLPEALVTQSVSLFSSVKPLLANLAVLYDEPDISLEDFDSHIGIHRPRRKRTYRWVKDECYYSSYIYAKQLAQILGTHRNSWGHTHVYLVTAYPAQGEFLRPAQGERFLLADGHTPGLHWRYHTAVLVIAHINKRYIPVVIDSFLSGQEAVSLATWLSHFHTLTQFRVTPFVRDNIVEESLQVPSETEGSSIWVKGNKYDPAPVVR